MTGTVTGQHYSQDFWNVRFNLHGGTFAGQYITYDEDDRVVNNPY